MPVRDRILIVFNLVLVGVLCIVVYANIQNHLALQSTLTKPVPLTDLLLPKVTTPLDPSTLSATSYLVLDRETGTVLAAQQPDQPLPPASTIKLLTVLTALDALKPSQLLTVPPLQAVGYRPLLSVGWQLSVEELVAASLISSANDATTTLLHELSPDEAEQRALLQKKAQQLGLHQTKIENGVGFDHPDQVSTARDLTKLAVRALEDEQIAAAVSQKQRPLSITQPPLSVPLFNTNELLSDRSLSVVGVKTGTTPEAGQVLITAIRIRDRDYLITLLQSSNRYADTRAIISWLHTLEWGQWQSQ